MEAFHPQCVRCVVREPSCVAALFFALPKLINVLQLNNYFRLINILTPNEKFSGSPQHAGASHLCAGRAPWVGVCFWLHLFHTKRWKLRLKLACLPTAFPFVR